MSITIDTNVLVYASDQGSPVHERAREIIEQLAAGPDLVYLFWPVAMGYLRVATHPRIFAQPLTAEKAVGNIASFISRPHVRTPGEGQRFWETYRSTSAETPVTGNLVADAHLVALMREHGVRRIWTRDRDFRKFDGIEPIDPFPAP